MVVDGYGGGVPCFDAGKTNTVVGEWLAETKHSSAEFLE